MLSSYRLACACSGLLSDSLYVLHDLLIGGNIMLVLPLAQACELMCTLRMQACECQLLAIRQLVLHDLLTGANTMLVLPLAQVCGSCLPARV